MELSLNTCKILLKQFVKASAVAVPDFFAIFCLFLIIAFSLRFNFAPQWVCFWMKSCFVQVIFGRTDCLGPDRTGSWRCKFEMGDGEYSIPKYSLNSLHRPVPLPTWKSYFILNHWLTIGLEISFDLDQEVAFEY